MNPLTGKRIQELYDGTAGEFDTGTERFEHIAKVLSNECETSMLTQIIEICEFQLKRLRQEGL